MAYLSLGDNTGIIAGVLVAVAVVSLGFYIYKKRSNKSAEAPDLEKQLEEMEFQHIPIPTSVM